MTLQRRIEEGEMFPRFYGRAYRDFCREQTVCYPFGLNFIANWLRHAHHWLMYGWPKRTKLEVHERMRANQIVDRIYRNQLLAKDDEIKRLRGQLNNATGRERSFDRS